MASQMEDVGNQFFLDIFFFFSLDPGDWADKQPAQPSLGRHHLPHRLRRQAVRILASDQTHAVLPRPLCV